MSDPESGAEFVQEIVYSEIPALEKQALVTVLLSGTFTWHGFNMPVTGCCCENFECVGKELEGNAPLAIFVNDPDDEKADEDGYFEMDI